MRTLSLLPFFIVATACTGNIGLDSDTSDVEDDWTSDSDSNADTTDTTIDDSTDTEASTDSGVDTSSSEVDTSSWGDTSGSGGTGWGGTGWGGTGWGGTGWGGWGDTGWGDTGWGDTGGSTRDTSIPATGSRLDPAPDCGAALSMAPLESGEYLATMGTTSNLSESVNANSCTSYATMGPDGFYKVVIANGQTLTVEVDGGAGDASLYLVTDCSDSNSCIYGIDQELSAINEVLLYTNTSGVEETLYLVVDSWSASGVNLTDFWMLVDLK